MALLGFLNGIAILILTIQVTFINTATLPLQNNLNVLNDTANAMIDRCATDPDWIGEGIVAQDCRYAINELWHSDVNGRPKGQEYEFYTFKGPRTHFPLPTVRTPRSHEWGTCKLQIILLSSFPPGALPGEPTLFNPKRSDVSIFDTVYAEAENILHTCVGNGKSHFRFSPAGGWSYTGKDSSIGVFILRKGSALDKEIDKTWEDPAALLGGFAGGDGSSGATQSAGDTATA